MRELNISPARVVFMSGYLDKHINLSTAASANLLEKPFTIREMVDAVENALMTGASL
jgi:FixJ family two-component response regulator